MRSCGCGHQSLRPSTLLPPRGFLLPTCRPRFREALSPCRRTAGRLTTGLRPPQNMFDGLIHKSAVAVEEPPAKWWVVRASHVPCLCALLRPRATAMQCHSAQAHSTRALHGLWMPPFFLLTWQLRADPLVTFFPLPHVPCFVKHICTPGHSPAPGAAPTP